MTNYIYPAIFEKEADGYVVKFSDLKGCVSEGDTHEFAYKYAKEVLALHLDGLKDVPVASKIEDVKIGKNQHVMFVEADPQDGIEYFKKEEVQKTFDAALDRKGYTKYQVAQILGVDRAFIGRIAKGAVNPSVDMAKRIGVLLGVDRQVSYAD